MRTRAPTSHVSLALLLLFACLSCRAVKSAETCEADGLCAGEAREKVIVCIPTTKRRTGNEHAANAIASVRKVGEANTEIMVLYDESVEKPEGANFYVKRVAHEFDAPCQFLRWRRKLVLDFVHVMESALDQSDAELLMWLEDDAVLLPNWREATANASNYCLTALHPCNCHSCREDWPFEYNGVGMVAGLFPRIVLREILPMIKAMFTVAPLDELVDLACKADPRFGPAMYHVPPLAEHKGDIAMDTTKGGPLPSVRFNSPAQSSTLTLASPHESFLVSAEVFGMVYDAEYSWLASVNGLPTGEEKMAAVSCRDEGGLWQPLSIKIESPTREQDCRDEHSLKVGMTLSQLEEGEAEIVLTVMEEESEEQAVVAQATLSFFIAYAEDAQADDQHPS